MTSIASIRVVRRDGSKAMATRTEEVVARFAVGALFDTKDGVDDALVRYALAIGRQSLVARSSQTRVSVVCGQLRLAGSPLPPPAADGSPALPAAVASELSPVQGGAPVQEAAAAVPEPRRRHRTKELNAGCAFIITVRKQAATGKWRVTSHTQHTCPASAHKVCYPSFPREVATCLHVSISFYTLTDMLSLSLTGLHLPEQARDDSADFYIEYSEGCRGRPFLERHRCE